MVLGYDCDGNIIEEYRILRAIWSNNIDIRELKDADPRQYCAIQDKNGYAFLRFRNTIVPLVNFSTKIGYLAIVVGVILSLAKLVWVGIAFEVIILLFQLVTLPVEFNASSRALKLIKEYGIVTNDEHGGAKKMLTSAALTYVAGVLSTLAEILRYILIFTGRNDR